MSARAEVVLASASPRRAALLAEAGVALRILPAEVDEDFDPRSLPEAAARELAERKALAVAARLGPQDAPARVLGGDTLVVLGGDAGPRYLGKPGDEVEAAAMLGALSGTRHRVVTGVAVVALGDDGRPAPVRSAAETTWVTMRPITPEEVAAYVASGEWRGKAGGYAIQETADRFVVRLEGGGFDNVVGLPVALALSLLAEPDSGR